MNENLYNMLAELMHNETYMTITCYLLDHPEGETVFEIMESFGTAKYGKTRQAVTDLEEAGVLYTMHHNKIGVTKFGKLLFKEFSQMGNIRNDAHGG